MFYWNNNKVINDNVNKIKIEKIFSCFIVVVVWFYAWALSYRRELFNICEGIWFILKLVDVLVIFFSIQFCLFSANGLFFICGSDVAFKFSIIATPYGIAISCFEPTFFWFFL